MDAFIIMLKNVIVFVLLAIPGFLVVKTKMLKVGQSGVLSKLLMYVAMPFLMISSAMNNLTLNGDFIVMLLVVAAIGVAYTLVVFLASKPLTAKVKEERARGMMRFATIFSNNGFLGLPLAMAVFGAGSTAYMVVIVINIVTNILMYTLGIYLISGDKKMMSPKKALLNPVLIGFVVGIVLNLLKVKDYAPEAATYSGYLSGLVTPLSMIILGMKMAAIKFSSLFTSLKTYYVSFLKLVVMPLVIAGILLIVKLIFTDGIVTADVVVGVFVAFAMPTAGLASTFADQVNGDTDSAVAFTLGSTVLSIVTIPVLYWIVTLLV